VFLDLDRFGPYQAEASIIGLRADKSCTAI